uniref:Uncharacterized protein n=1 Tax=Chelonoidis abingdonii TaxID=106734 RepID=A0A8C0GVK8_CHEAB
MLIKAQLSVQVLSISSSSATCWPGYQWHQTHDQQSASQPSTPQRSASLSLPSSWDDRRMPPRPTGYKLEVLKLYKTMQ